ncbi:hypothetical protein [Thermogemmatispora onikobensis]|uniref:hypothetical protein n=1 Tax=Thermogemmatispora onikobensis TaxID=732234 RepID=UPI000852987F|nr:hypothetical protein [Thermogemmatispora onikobensis]
MQEEPAREAPDSGLLAAHGLAHHCQRPFLDYRQHIATARDRLKKARTRAGRGRGVAGVETERPAEAGQALRQIVLREG